MNVVRPAAGFMLVGLAVLVLSSGGAAKQAATGLVAFQSDRDGNLEIYVANADGTQPRNLTQDPASDIHPTWSRNGQWIAFSSNRSGNWQLYAMELGGPATRLLVSPGAATNPTWSRDGRRIAFEANRGRDWDIHVIDVTITGSRIVAKGERNLTQGPTADDRDASWAPDSRRIVFMTTAKKPVNWNLAIVRDSPTPAKPRLLLATSADEFRPSWARTGRIFFSRFNGLNYDVFWTDVKGTRVRRITSNLEEDADPDVSTSGLSVAFTTARAGNYDVYTMTADGKRQAPLTQTSANDMNPTWQPGADAGATIRAGATFKVRLLPKGRERVACTGIYRPGTSGTDSYVGTDCDDELHGAGGADILTGKKGVDSLYGGTEGDDFYLRDKIKDHTVYGGKGSDCARLDSTDPWYSVETRWYSDTAYC